jgi:hypothetical protein
MPKFHPLSLAQRHLAPGDSLSEILFGLIMTLTFTLGAGILVQEGPDAVRELLIATIGCNIAWGIIDGVFYLNGQIFERARLARLGRLIRASTSDEAASALVASELGPTLEMTVPGAERVGLCLAMARHVRASEVQSVRLQREDVYGALANFWLVFFASIPAALPFLFIADAWTALRVSNAILLALLFFTGYHWARHTVLHPVATGAAFLSVGVVLVAVAIALGG